ncbi:hypothetical protein NP493_218g04023 [Ridgeia piscesae]|uniref:Uncharacterized protein n=1 Tax=Ridgeia piscesae TaxID=27915 RepID=A0AAD9UE44_RIDPI|nr:hypothetical protein NP493_218g04023 [Ridgeia piscesae]
MQLPSPRCRHWFVVSINSKIGQFVGQLLRFFRHDLINELGCFLSLFCGGYAIEFSLSFYGVSGFPKQVKYTHKLSIVSRKITQADQKWAFVRFLQINNQKTR